MTPTASKTRTSQRGRRLVSTSFRTSPYLTSIRQDQPIAFGGPVASRRERSLSVPQTNQAAQDVIKKIQEDDKDITTAHALDYPQAFKDPDPVLPGLASDEVDDRNKVVVAFGEGMRGVFNSNKSTGEELFLDFISTVQPQSSRT